jgi:hypothetical protein
MLFGLVLVLVLVLAFDTKPRLQNRIAYLVVELELEIVPSLPHRQAQAHIATTATDFQRARKHMSCTNADRNTSNNPAHGMTLKHQREGTDQLWYKTSNTPCDMC